MNQTPTKVPVTPSKPKPVKRRLQPFKLNSKNLRLLLIGSLGLSFVLFSSILLLGLSTLATKSKSMVDLKVQSQTADTQLANLEQAKKQVQQYSYFKDVAKTVIPNDKNQAEDIVEINQIASEAGITLQSITFPTSTLGLTTSGLDATTSSSTQKAITQAKPVSGIAGLYSLELTVSPASNANLPLDQQVTYDKMLDFLNRIESNRHTAQIEQVNITPPNSGTNTSSSTSPTNNAFNFSLVINIFIKP